MYERVQPLCVGDPVTMAKSLGNGINEIVKVDVAKELTLSGCHRPNETELGHRWRERALLQSLVKSIES